MRRSAWIALVAVLISPVITSGQAGVLTKEQKIAQARSAAPATIASNATVMDWPSSEGGQPVELVKGSNGWVCFTDMPHSTGLDPMCLDSQWLKWAEAWQGKTIPALDHVGIGYMINAANEGSNTDPYGMERTAANEWGVDPPHLMVIVPDLAALEGMPTERGAAPWVMWRGTPYAHIMIPLGPPKK
jgi:hypothetical protein